MKIFQRLKDLYTLLLEYDGCFAICGGVAASIYREVPRHTGDIDVCLIDYGLLPAKVVAAKIIEGLGYRPIAGFVCGSNESSVKEQALVVGRETQAGGFIGVDFLLPVIPWIPKAVVRAQANKLDYGFGRLATITREDLIIAKLFALNSEPSRLNDIDDIKEVSKGALGLDRIYLQEQIDSLKLKNSGAKYLDRLS